MLGFFVLGVSTLMESGYIGYTRAFGDGPRNFEHGQVTWTTPELAPPLLTPTPHQREDVSALGRFNVHRCPTRRVFNGIGLELVARPIPIPLGYRGRPLCGRLNLKADV
ncbi:uncharacterized protein TNCV_1320761 [Trichonephila clavipes]|nr:uncharacterized protein TNCV_1320761 [Trichonephila clavipes]